jgi:hypothetical protein
MTQQTSDFSHSRRYPFSAMRAPEELYLPLCGAVLRPWMGSHLNRSVEFSPKSSDCARGLLAYFETANVASLRDG